LALALSSRGARRWRSCPATVRNLLTSERFADLWPRERWRVDAAAEWL